MNQPHGDCKYFGFLGLVKHCRHPDHAEPIHPRRTFSVIGNGGKCSHHVNRYDVKVFAGQPPTWAQPVNLNPQPKEATKDSSA